MKGFGASAVLAMLVAGDAFAGGEKEMFELVGEKECAAVVLPACPDEATKLSAIELTNYVRKDRKAHV